jgi:hypothetical protein
MERIAPEDAVMKSLNPSLTVSLIAQLLAFSPGIAGAEMRCQATAVGELCTVVHFERSRHTLHDSVHADEVCQEHPDTCDPCGLDRALCMAPRLSKLHLAAPAPLPVASPFTPSRSRDLAIPGVVRASR